MSYPQKSPTVWLGKETLNETTEIGLSEKGYIGIWVKGRWQGGITATILQDILNRAEDMKALAEKGIELSAERQEVNKQVRMDTKLLKEAEALKKKALVLAQAGVDLTSIFEAAKAKQKA